MSPVPPQFRLEQVARHLGTWTRRAAQHPYISLTVALVVLAAFMFGKSTYIGEKSPATAEKRAVASADATVPARLQPFAEPNWGPPQANGAVGMVEQLSDAQSPRPKGEYETTSAYEAWRSAEQSRLVHGDRVIITKASLDYDADGKMAHFTAPGGGLFGVYRDVSFTHGGSTRIDRRIDLEPIEGSIPWDFSFHLSPAVAKRIDDEEKATLAYVLSFHGIQEPWAIYILDDIGVKFPVHQFDRDNLRWNVNVRARIKRITLYVDNQKVREWTSEP